MSEPQKAGALVEEMRREAEAERSEIEKEAEASVTEIRQQTESKAKQLEEQAFRELESELEDYARQGRLKAEMEAATIRSEFRTSIVDEVFKEAATLLDRFVRRESSLPFSYDECFTALVIDAARAVSFDGTVKVSARDADLCREALRSAGAEMDVETSEEIPGTVVAVSSDGTRVVNNSVRTRLERARTRLAPLVLEVLGGEHSG